MNHYQDNQYGKHILGVLILATASIIPSYYYQWGTNPIDLKGMIVLCSMFIIIISLFFRMKTIINDDEIRIIYGIGIIRFKIKLNEINSCSVVRNAWYNGIGIRYIHNGMIYSIHGFDAVELKFKNTSRVIRIGSSHPLLLKEEIEKRITSEG